MFAKIMLAALLLASGTAFAAADAGNLCDYEPGITHSVITPTFDQNGNQTGQMSRSCSISLEDAEKHLTALEDSEIAPTDDFSFGVSHAGFNGIQIGFVSDYDKRHVVALNAGKFSMLAEVDDVSGEKMRFAAVVDFQMNDSVSFGFGGAVIDGNPGKDAKMGFRAKMALRW